MSCSKPEIDLKSDPDRKNFIIQHRAVRHQLYECRKGLPEESSKSVITFSIAPTFMSFSPLVDHVYPEIFLKDMDKTEELIHHGRTLVLTIIDDPMIGLSAVHFMAEDKNKDITRLAVYGLPHDKSTCETFAFGTVIGIVNPYLRIASADGKFAIRVDDTQSIFQVGRKKDMCRYCGEENATKRCADCKRTYCDRHCQVKDWKDLKHKMVCETPLAWSINRIKLNVNFANATGP